LCSNELKYERLETEDVTRKGVLAKEKFFKTFRLQVPHMRGKPQADDIHDAPTFVEFCYKLTAQGRVPRT